MPHSYATAQNLLPLLLDSLQDYALFMMDLEGRIVTWTPGVQRLLGYDESEFVGQEAALIFTPQDRADNVPQAEFDGAKLNGRAEDRRWHQRKDGNVFWANGQMIGIRDEEGTLRGYAKLLRDETRRKETEDALRETRQRLQTALDVGRIGTWQWDIPNNRVIADANLARFFGMSPEDAAGDPIEHYIAAIHPEDTASLTDAIEQSIRENTAFEADYRIPQSNGETLWVEARGQVQPDAQGQAALLNGVVLDISARKQAEAALRHSEERYRTLFEAITSGFCVIEMLFDAQNEPYDYRFLEINPAFEQQTGLHDAIGKTVLEMVPSHEKYWFQIYGGVALTGESVHFENEAAGLGRDYDVHAFRVGLPEEHRVAVLFTDITERKRGEAALRQAHAKAEETNRMKDEFLATLSHELRTPLNAILGWASMLRLGHLDAEEQQQGFEVIERNSRAQAQLINDLLDVSRILTGKLRLEMHPLELADVLEDAINTVTPTLASKQLSLEIDLAPLSGHVMGDKDRLNQVFWNLLSNAIKFTPAGGKIWVSMRSVGGQVQVQIRDNGQGIDREFLPFVFERFRQADASSTRAYGGLGIGLALVRHLIEAHGGTVSAHSEGANQGSTFTVTFPPLASQAETQNQTEEIKNPALPRALEFEDTETQVQLPPLSNLRVLVVDDEPDARELVQLLLQQRGAHVEVAADAPTAYALIESSHQRQPFDILVSDVAMPGEDGHSLIRRIRASEAGEAPLPAIALTAYASHKDRVAVLLTGFQVHLAKPVDPIELVATVAALTGRTGHDELRHDPAQ